MPGAKGSKSAGSGDGDQGDDSISDLIAETVQTSVRTSINLMKVPVVVYAGLVSSWAKAIDAVLENMQPDPDDDDTSG